MKSSKIGDCKKHLAGRLRQPRKAREVIDELKLAGYSESTIYRANRELGVISSYEQGLGDYAVVIWRMPQTPPQPERKAYNVVVKTRNLHHGIRVKNIELHAFQAPHTRTAARVIVYASGSNSVMVDMHLTNSELRQLLSLTE